MRPLPPNDFSGDEYFAQIVTASMFCYSASRAILVWAILPENDVQRDPEPCLFLTHAHRSRTPSLYSTGLRSLYPA
jgi:hypothetical protein